jgi:hypothetical protein
VARARLFLRQPLSTGRGQDVVKGRIVIRAAQDWSIQLMACEETDLMAVQSPDEERQWAAEKRDFVADRPDELAAFPNATGDTRNITADERELATEVERAAAARLPDRPRLTAAQRMVGEPVTRGWIRR